MPGHYYNPYMKQFMHYALVLPPYFTRPQERVLRHTMTTRSQNYRQCFDKVMKDIKSFYKRQGYIYLQVEQ